MDLKASCPCCGGRVCYDQSLAYETASCPHCGHDFVLPVSRNGGTVARKRVVSKPVMRESTVVRLPYVRSNSMILPAMCPVCEGDISYEESLVYETVSCPHCDNPFVLPSTRSKLPRQQQRRIWKSGPAVPCSKCGVFVASSEVSDGLCSECFPGPFERLRREIEQIKREHAMRMANLDAKP